MLDCATLSGRSSICTDLWIRNLLDICIRVPKPAGQGMSPAIGEDFLQPDRRKLMYRLHIKHLLGKLNAA